MNQYFVKYSINNRSKLNQFASYIDVHPKENAIISGMAILTRIVELHNLNVKLQKENFVEIILHEDIVIEVLTRLN